MTAIFKVLDLSLMVISIIVLSIIVYKNKKKFEIEGPMYLYRTKFGIKVIDWFGKKHARWLRALEYPLYIVCYALMISGLFYFTYTLYEYIFNPAVTQALKAPIIFPVVPYFTEFFGLKSFLPTFYFISFLVSIGITMVVHEFSHGIYARMYNVKIKSTGFALLRAWKIPLPFFGAFVEQDDKQMVKVKVKGQLSIIGAGVFSNILTMLLFMGILWVFFLLAYQPLGVVFDDYAKIPVNTSEIGSVNGVPIAKLNLSSLDYQNQTNYVKLQLKDNSTYFTTAPVLNYSINENLGFVGVYENSPAFTSGLRGVITKIDGKRMNSDDELRDAIRAHKPGDKMTIQTIYNKTELNFEVTLGNKSGIPFLGIASYSREVGGVKKLIIYLSMFTPKRENVFTGVVYESKIGEAGGFFFDLIWWIVLLNFAVAIANMLPAGFFDGGRYFLLTVWGITKSKKTAERAFKWSTWYVISLLLLFMLWWALMLF